MWNKIFEEFSKKKVLVCGDVMLDVYVYGDVERISPEAPVPIVNIRKTEYKCGGAGNVALNVRRLGSGVYLVGMVGDDSAARILKKICERNDIEVDFLQLRRKTTVKKRIISKGQQLLRLDKEESDILKDEEQSVIAEKLNDIFSKHHFDAVIIEDYDKGFISPLVFEVIREWAHKRGMFIGVDPKKRNFLTYKDINLLKPNLKEFLDGIKLDHENISKENIGLNARNYRKNNRIKNLMITLGQDGIYYVNDFEEGLEATISREVVDITGAGDTVISIATLCLISGLNLKDTAKLCNSGAGVVCGKVGTYAPTPQEILTLLKKNY